MSNPQKPERVVYPLDEARALLGGISRQTAYNLINSGQLKSIKIGRRRLISAEAITECARSLQNG